MIDSTLKMPVLSIGMPVYNGAEHMREALDCLLSQTFEDFELIISDNASTDDTELIGREYAKRDPRVQYFRHDENMVAIHNFNWVFNHANKGHCFMWAACDDLWDPNFVLMLYHQLQQNSELVLAFCFFQAIAYDGEPIGKVHDLRHLGIDDRFKRARHYIWSHEKDGKANPIYGIFKRSAVESIGGFKLWADSDWGPDMIFLFAVLLQGNLKVLDQALFRKRDAKPKVSQGRCNGRLVSAQAQKRVEEIKIEKAIRRIDYWEGYVRVLNSIGGFNRFERFVLVLGIWCRSRKYYRKKYDHMIRSKLYALFSRNLTS